MNFNEKIVDQILCKAKTERLISILPFTSCNEHSIVYYTKHHTNYHTGLTTVVSTRPVSILSDKFSCIEILMSWKFIKTYIASEKVAFSRLNSLEIKGCVHFRIDLYVVWNKMFVSYNSWNRQSSRFKSSRAGSYSSWFWLRRLMVMWLQGCRKWFFVEFCHSRFWFLIKLII